MALPSAHLRRNKGALNSCATGDTWSMRRSLDPGRGRRASLTFVACWAIPGAAFCGWQFYQGIVPAQPDGWGAPGGTIGALVANLVIAYALFWLCLPGVLLIVGVVQLVRTARRGWPLWAAGVVAGIGLDPIGLWSMGTGNGRAGWPSLAVSIGYLVVGAALLAILLAVPRTLGSVKVRPAVKLADLSPDSLHGLGNLP